jgi:hypothetical protein
MSTLNDQGQTGSYTSDNKGERVQLHAHRLKPCLVRRCCGTLRSPSRGDRARRVTRLLREVHLLSTPQSLPTCASACSSQCARAEPTPATDLGEMRLCRVGHEAWLQWSALRAGVGNVDACTCMQNGSVSTTLRDESSVRACAMRAFSGEAHHAAAPHIMRRAHACK